MLLSKDQIFSAKDREPVDIEVPEWGGTVRVLAMSGADRDDWESEILDAEGKVDRKSFRCRLLVKCLADEAGERLFTDAEADDLGRKSAKVIDRLYDAASRRNGIGTKDEAELVKNSDAAR